MKMGEDWYQGDGFQLQWPYDHQGIQKLKIIHRFNDHARCYLTVRMTEEQAHECLFHGSLQDTILIQRIDESSKEYWFAGGIYNLEMVVEDGIHYVEVEGISRSFELDIHLGSRSFQNKGTTYTQLIKQLVQAHPQGDAQNEATEPDTEINELIVQYQETDWHFLKRLASRVGTVILPDLTMDAPRIYFGVPDFSWGKNMKAYSYSMMQDMGSYLSYEAQAVGNESLRMLEADCIQYRVKSRYYYQVGENVGFKRQIWVIYESNIIYEQGIIRYEYVLVQRKAVRRKSKLNQAIQGAALEGKVVARANNMVQVHLNIDDQYDEAGNWWFPYSAEGNNIFHSLPDEGAKIKVYFPSGIEKKAIAVNSSRGSGEEMRSRAVFQKPTTKVFHIPGNTKMELGEDGVLFSKDTVRMNLEGGNIQVEANEDLIITVANKLELISQEKGEDDKSSVGSKQPRSIKCKARNKVKLEVFEDQYIEITKSYVAIRGKKVNFNKIDMPFVDMLAEEELKELYIDELMNDDAERSKMHSEKWKEKRTQQEREGKALQYIEVTKEEVQAAITAKVNQDPGVIQKAKERLGRIDENQLQAKFLSRGGQDQLSGGGKDQSSEETEGKDEKLAKIKNNYATRYWQIDQLMGAAYRMQNADSDQKYKEACNQYLKMFEEIQQSELANGSEGNAEVSKYFSKAVPEVVYYSRFNHERIVIASQYGDAFFGVISGSFFMASAIIAIVASVATGGTSTIVWSLLVGELLVSAGQMYVSMEKMGDLSKGYANTTPEILGMGQAEFDKVDLLLTVMNLYQIGKHGAKFLDSAMDTNRMNLLEGVSYKAGWKNFGQGLQRNFDEFLEELKRRRAGGTGGGIPETAPKGTGQAQIKLGTGKVGDFSNIEGASIDDILSRIPENATRRELTPIEGKVTEGFEYKWVQDGKTMRVRVHGPDASAPAGSNAANGWIVRVQEGKKYYDPVSGEFQPPGISNIDSPFYNEDIANRTHIPIKTPE